MSTDPYPTIRWQEAGVEHVALWRSEAGVAAPEMVVVADDTLKVGAACRLAAQGTAILWRGDYQNARNLLQALARRVDRGPREGAQKKITNSGRGVSPASRGAGAAGGDSWTFAGALDG